jgi:peptidoglycan hydrolase-like protein with peptidoglycan-binding domain
VVAELRLNDRLIPQNYGVTSGKKQESRTMNSGPTISIGSTGHDVRRLQPIFVMTKVLGPSNITGTFDPTTEQAVKDFQQGAGLTMDGIVGPITWQALPAPIQIRRC